MERLLRLTVLVALLAMAGCTADPAGGRTGGAATTAAPTTAAERAPPPPTLSDPDPETGYSVPGALRRPLVLPPLGPGGACLADRPHHVSDEVGPGSGPGPAYPVGLNADGTLNIHTGGDFTGPYGGQKVLWAVDAWYAGPVLIRGVRLDAPGDVRFNHGANPPDAMQLPPATAPTGWRFWPSYTRVRAPGCYAYQVDGLDFSYRVVFRAIDEGSS